MRQDTRHDTLAQPKDQAQAVVPGEASSRDIAPAKALAEERVQFRLLDLFVATTVFCVCLTIFRFAGILGALMSFVAAFIFTSMLHYRVLPDDTPQHAAAVARRRVLKDFI